MEHLLKIKDKGKSYKKLEENNNRMMAGFSSETNKIIFFKC